MKSAGSAGSAGPAGPAEASSRGTLVIASQRCKGCELCIPACPPRVLEMSQAANAIGFRYPELSPGCTGCGACLMVCPDFCFEVYRYDEPVAHPSDRGDREHREHREDREDRA